MNYIHTFLGIWSILSIAASFARAETNSNDECGFDAACQKCPMEFTTKNITGHTFCCSDCSGLPIIDSGKCFCFRDQQLTSKIIFSGPSTGDTVRRVPLVLGGTNHLTNGIRRDPNVKAIVGYNNPYYDQTGDIFGWTGLVKKSVGEMRKLFAPTRVDIQYKPTTDSNNISPRIRKTLTMMADAIDNLDARLHLVEDQLAHKTIQTGSIWPSLSGTVTTVKNTINVTPGCKGQFRSMMGTCIFASSWTDQRTNWKNAEEICKGKGGKLAETLSPASFSSLSTYLSSSPSTAGYSYWLGSIYPGAVWLWMSGSRVSLKTTYWQSGSTGLFSIPGDTSHGRCLTFHYDLSTKSYHFQGEQCAKDKYFLCEMKT